MTRTLAADPSVRALFRRIYLTARAGSFADVSFHAAFRYPPSRVLRGLADNEWSFPLRRDHVTRNLVRRRSWGSYPSQV